MFFRFTFLLFALASLVGAHPTVNAPENRGVSHSTCKISAIQVMPFLDGVQITVIGNGKRWQLNHQDIPLTGGYNTPVFTQIPFSAQEVYQFVDETDESCALSVKIDNSMACGNGRVELGEQCEDGNTIAGDGCSATCTIEEGYKPACGDFILTDLEQCDDGNLDNGDGCNASCQLEEGGVPGCGDGVVRAPEQCDDGNFLGGDGCSVVCKLEEGENPLCGNKLLEVGEECDDGNLVNGDGCSSTCTTERENCSINANAGNIVCQNRGTSNPNDDRFTFEVTPTGGTSGSFWQLSGNGLNENGSYDATKTIFAGLINNTDGNYTITDNADKSCKQNFEIVPPQECSPDCNLNVLVKTQSCNNQGTTDPTDDTVTLTLMVMGSDNEPWTIVRKLNSAGTAYAPLLTGSADGTFTTAPINVQQATAGYGGSKGFVVWFMKDGISDCLGDIWVPASSCSSDTCQLNSPSIVQNCNDNGTPANASDDYMTYSIMVTGSNTGANYSIMGGDTRSGLGYGSSQGVFGNFDPNTNLNLTITDGSNSDCSTTATVYQTGTCSPEPPCAINTPTLTSECNDNGTDSDSSDDFYTYNIVGTGLSTSTSYNVSGGDTQQGLVYNVLQGDFGNFPPNSTLNLTLTDGQDSSCTGSGSINFGDSCSTPCSIETPVIQTQCNGNGTADPNDDTFTFSYTVNATNGSTTYETSGSDIRSGLSYGTNYTSLNNFPISGGNVALNIQDSANGNCILIQQITPPASCSTPCSIEAPFIQTQCNGNGTATTADDYYTFTINAGGPGTGTTYSMTNGTGLNLTGLAYNTTNGTYGNYTPSSTLLYTLTDIPSSSCTRTGSINFPATTCSIPEPTGSLKISKVLSNPPAGYNNATSYAISIDCSDNAFDQTLNLTAGGMQVINNIPVGTTCTITEPTLPSPPSGYTFGTPIVSPSSVTITANTESSVQVTNSLSQNSCSINPGSGNLVCQDQGTIDPDDDQFTFDITPIGGTSGANWLLYGNGVNQSGAYGTTATITGGDIEEGTKAYTLTDSVNGVCSANFSVTPPASCSPDCNLDANLITQTCNDNGTADPSDDTITLTFAVTGSNNEPWSILRKVNASSTKIMLMNGNTDGTFTSPPINVANALAGYPNSDGFVIWFMKDGYMDCVGDLRITANTCSGDVCYLNSPNVIGSCNDNGTTNNSADDFMTYSILVTGDNTAATYNVSGGDTRTELAYGSSQGSFGNFNPNANLNLTITDSANPACNTTATVYQTGTCSPPVPCNINAPVVSTQCSNNGTGSNTADDYYTFTLTTTGTSTTTSYNISGDYNEIGVVYNVPQGPFGNFNPNTTLNLTLTDAQNNSCTENATINFGASCSTPCSIEAPFIQTQCNGNGTATTADDYYTFTINAGGPGTGTTYSMTNGTGLNLTGLAYNTTNGTYGNYTPSSTLLYTLTDVPSSSCTRTGSINFPATTCSIPEPTGSLKISKVLSNPPAGYNNATSYAISIDCSDNAFDQTLNLTAGGMQVINNIPVGTTCTISEPTLPSPPSGYAFGTPIVSPSSVTITANTQSSVQVTNSLTLQLGGIEITKILTNPPPGYNTTTTYAIMVDCDNNIYDQTVNLVAGAVHTINNIPGGVICMISEPTLPTPPSGYTYQTPIISPSSVTVLQTARITAVTVTNSLSQNQTCSINTPNISTQCNGNGTADPNDDTFTFSYTVNATNGSTTYETSGSDIRSGLSYGTSYTSLNNFPISGGNVALNIQDSADGNCILIQQITPPASCSSTCTIEPVFAPYCNPNGTPNNPADDTFQYIVGASGNNLGTAYHISGADTQNNLPYNVTSGPFGNFALGSTHNVIVTDAQNPSCTANRALEFPAACECTVPNGTATNVATTCQNPTAQVQLTGFNPGDRYAYTTGFNGVGYTGNANYFTATPIPVDGNLFTVNNNNPVGTISIRIFNAGGCYKDVSINHVVEADCNGGCTLPEYFLSANTYCDNGDLLSDLVLFLESDADRFDIGIGATYQNAVVIDDPLPAVVLNTLPVTGGDELTVKVFNGNDTCALEQSVTFDDLDCTSSCVPINFTLSNPTSPQCDVPDGGSVTLNNYAPATQYQVVQNGSPIGGLQNIPANGVILGLTAGDHTIRLFHGDNNICISEQTIVIPGLSNCNPICVMQVPQTVAYCNTGGTQNDPSDDTFGYTINANVTIINAQVVSGLYNVSGDDIRTNLPYGIQQGPFGWYPLSQGQLDLTVSDVDFSPTCSQNTTVIAPDDCTFCTDPTGICAEVTPQCALQTISATTTCNNNGTPTNPADDIFSYTLNVTKTGNTTNPTYHVSGGDTRTNLNYNTPYTFGGSAGQFPISGGNLSLQIVDSNLSTCATTTTLVVPQTCSSSLDLALDKKLSAGQNSTVAPGDLVNFTLTIYNQGNLNATNIQVTDYPDLTRFQPFNVANNPSGSTSGGISLPYSWTNAGVLNTTGTLAVGQSMQIPVRLRLRADAANGIAQNTAEISNFGGGTDIDSTPDGINGNTPGEIPPALEDDQVSENGQGGNDEDDHDFAQVTITGGLDCTITADFQGLCNDNGTKNDATDDTFTFTANATGVNVGATYQIIGEINQAGIPYNTPSNAFGPIDIAVGLLNITLIDETNPGCNLSTMVIAPDDCSDKTDVDVNMDPLCKMDLPITVATCNDNGTPTNVNDDTFTYVTTVTSRNGTSGYYISGDDTRSNLTYGIQQGAFGPFPIAAGNLELFFTDNQYPRCKNKETVFAPPTCSDTDPICDINDPTVSVTCSNNGTNNNAADDRFTYTINASGANVGTAYNISGADTRSGLLYGTSYTSTQSFPISGGDITITLTDANVPYCFRTKSIMAAGTCSNSGQSADVRLAKSVDKATYRIGDILVYTLTLTNDGPNDATNINVSDSIPAGTTFVSATPSVGTFNAQTGLWFVPTLANGASVTMTLQVRVN